MPLVKFDCDAGGGDAPKRDAADIDAVDALEFKIEIDDRVGVIVFGFADQSLDRRQTVDLGSGRVPAAPTGAGPDPADRTMAAERFGSIEVADLHDFHFFRWKRSPRPREAQGRGIWVFAVSAS
jgi:hypothetical protein